MHTKPKMIWGGIVSLHFGTDSSILGTEPNNRIRTVNKVISEIES